MRILPIFLLLFSSVTFCATPHRINIDGNLDEWTTDEIIIRDNLSDSWWGQDNEIKCIYLTWDNEALYVGATFSLYFNAFLIVFDLGLRRGVSDLKRLDWYPRDLVFQAFTADAILALWNGELSTGGFRLIRGNGQTSPAQANIVVGRVSSTEYTLEAKLPWGSLYQSETPVVQGARINLVSAICGGDYSQAGDIAPDQQPGAVRITSFFSIAIDENANGYPDTVGSVLSAGGVVANAFLPLELKILRISPDVVNISRGDQLEVEYSLSIGARLNMSIFSLDGKRINDLIMDETYLAGRHTILWDGKDRNRNFVNSGIYIVNIVADNAVADKKAFVVVR